MELEYEITTEQANAAARVLRAAGIKTEKLAETLRQAAEWNSQENRTPNMPGYATCACADSHRLRLTSGGR